MAKSTIKLTKYADVIIERRADAAIIPGMLLELNSDNEVLKHDAAGGNVAPVMFALEQELEGKGIEDSYAAGDLVQTWIPGRGDVVYAILADEEDVAIGDYLESHGDGYLRKHVAVGDTSSTIVGTFTVYPNQIVAMALEAMDLLGSTGADASNVESSAGVLAWNKRIRVMVV